MTFHFALKVKKLMWRFQFLVVRVGVQCWLSLIVNRVAAKLIFVELRIRVWRGIPVFVTSRILIRRVWSAAKRLRKPMPHSHISLLPISPPLPPLSFQLL